MNSDPPSGRAFIPVSTVHEINGNFLDFLMYQWSQDRPGATQFPLFSLWQTACFLAGLRWQVCGLNNGDCGRTGFRSGGQTLVEHRYSP